MTSEPVLAQLSQLRAQAAAHKGPDAAGFAAVCTAPCGLLDIIKNEQASQ